MRLVESPRFKRAFRKFVQRDRALQRQIEETLRQMESDIHAVSLGSYKLSGELQGFWACSCGYDCRIVYAIDVDRESGERVILLLDIGYARRSVLMMRLEYL